LQLHSSFCEVLEASLIIGIVMAACRAFRAEVRCDRRYCCGSPGRHYYCGAAGKIAESVSGMGQEILNAVILGAAVLMLGLAQTSG